MDTASPPTAEAEIAALRVALAERDQLLAERDARLLNGTHPVSAAFPALGDL